MAPNDTAQGRSQNRRVEVVLADEVNLQPVGRVNFSGGSLAAGIGFSWGVGTLVYKGQSYKFKVDGFNVGDVGASKIDATGGVYNLTNIADFDGNYAAVDVGVTLAGGGSLITMRNPHGVVIQVRTNEAGLRLNAGASGVTINMRP